MSTWFYFSNSNILIPGTKNIAHIALGWVSKGVILLEVYSLIQSPGKIPTGGQQSE